MVEKGKPFVPVADMPPGALFERGVDIDITDVGFDAVRYATFDRKDAFDLLPKFRKEIEACRGDEVYAVFDATTQDALYVTDNQEDRARWVLESEKTKAILH